MTDNQVMMVSSGGIQAVTKSPQSSALCMNGCVPPTHEWTIDRERACGVEIVTAWTRALWALALPATTQSCVLGQVTS